MSDSNSGQYYASLNPDGTVIGFYYDFVNTNIPEDAIKITTDQWRQWIVNTNGLRWQDDQLVAYTPPQPQLSDQEKAIALLDNPIVTVLCNSKPTLDGDYSVSTSNRGNITGIALGINAGLGLPSGESTFSFLDTDGNLHPWPADQFIAFAKDVMAYIYQLSLVASGSGGSLPNSTITIA